MWNFDFIDSSFTDANGNVTHQKLTTWNETTKQWDLELEIKSTYTQQSNNRKRIREVWVADSNKFVLADSFIFNYAADTILESGFYFGRDSLGNFDTLTYLTSFVNASKDTVVQTYFGRDSSGNNFDPYLRRTFALNSSNEVIGVEEFDLFEDEGISKAEFIKSGSNETIIEYEWDFTLEDWMLSEKQEYEYNTKGFLTLNSFYYYNANQSKWTGAEKRTYVFDTDHETVLSRTEYDWNNGAWAMEYKADFTYDKDNDPVLVEHYEHDGSNWVIEEKDYFYYGTWTVGQEATHRATIAAYPNPAIDFIHFSTTLQEITVYDLQGQLVQKATNASALEITDLQPGIYQVTGLMHQQPITCRFIKQ